MLTRSWSRITGGVGIPSGSQEHYRRTCTLGKSEPHTVAELPKMLQHGGHWVREQLCGDNMEGVVQHLECDSSSVGPRAQGARAHNPESGTPCGQAEAGRHRTARTLLPLGGPKVFRSVTPPP